MMQAIPTVYNKIFGISYLQGKQVQQLKDQWQLRMSESDAFFIEAEPDDDYQTTVTALCESIQEQEIVVNAHDPCILAFFVDLQKGADPKLLRQIEAGVRSVLNTSIQAVIQFGYAGKLGLEDPAVQRENACKLVDSNREKFSVQHRLCLVASPFLAGINEWKPVCIYLDVLSRQNVPSNLLPGTGSGYVGYLRYGEFDKDAYDTLVARDEELATILGNGGSMKFGELLKDKERELQCMVRQGFPLKGSCQPLHPDMFLTPGGVFGRGQRLARFAAARDTSETALEMTGQRLKKDIAHAFDASIADAEAILKKLADAAPLGLALQEDADDMARLLAAPADSHWEPAKPTLSFREHGYAQEIQLYLEKIRDHECSIQIQRFYEALQKATSTLVDGDFAVRKAALEKEQKRTRARLKKMYPTKEFCEKFAYTADLPEGQFSPVSASGEAQKFLLCTNALIQTVETYTKGASTPVYCIANSAPDNAPLKGVQIVFLNCPGEGTKEVMYQLLPEVNV